MNHSRAWDEILKYLKKWKTNIPDFPVTNFDLNADSSFAEIKNLSPRIYKKILENDNVFNEIVLVLFPEKKTLYLLLDYFKSKAKKATAYKTIADLLEERL